MPVAVPGLIRLDPDNQLAVDPAPVAFAVPRLSRSATRRTRKASHSTMCWVSAPVTDTSSVSPRRHGSTPVGSVNTLSKSMRRTLVRTTDSFRFSGRNAPHDQPK